MNIVHLYLRPAPTGALNVFRSTFTAGGHQTARETVTAEDRPAWLPAQLAAPELKAVYNCAGTGVTKPDGCPVPWFDLPAGHPCEKL